MTNVSEGPKIPSIVFGSSIDHMVDALRKLMNATDDELTYLRRITTLRTKQREPLSSNQNGYGSPSVVIDDFLYHGDLGHASKLDLLNRLGIRHIINISNCSLDAKITDNFNVLWINLNDDFGSNIKRHFDGTNQFLYECKQKNEKVLVHCEMGISRSSSVVLAYLMKYHHDTLEKAYDYLLERRRMAAPNLSFLIQLIRYEKDLRAKREIDERKNNDDKQNPIEPLNPKQDLVIENNYTQIIKTGASNSKKTNQKMTNISNDKKKSTVTFGPSIDFLVDALRSVLNATDDELHHVKRITDLRTRKREPLPSGRRGYGYPSIVIDDFLYHGDLGHASNIGLLNQLGIRHIINISDNSLDKKITDNFNVLWINLHDELGSDIKKYFNETNQFLYECKQKNEKVLVHCQMGISRSSSIVLAYLMKYHHDTLEKAYDYLLERRRIAAPNLSFLIQLIRYENELRATKEIDETKNNDDKQNPIVQLDPKQDFAVENNDQ